MIALAIFMTSSASFACSDNLKNHPEECKQQDRYLRLKADLAKYSIKVEQLSGYALSRALGSEVLTQIKGKSTQPLSSNELQSPELLKWQNGQKFIQSLNTIYLQPQDVLKLHKSLFSSKGLIATVGTDAGKLRTSQGITNPREHFSCQDNVLNEATLTYLGDPDLRSVENYPLLEIENVLPCPGAKGAYSGTLVYYKGASMKEELTRWLNDYNDMLIRFEKGMAEDITPTAYMADMRRWFLAIAPFSYGNLEVANALADYFMFRLQLFPVPMKDLKSSHLQEVEQSREQVKTRAKDTLSFIETCLYENKVRPVSPLCGSL